VGSHDPDPDGQQPLKMCLQKCGSHTPQKWPIDDLLLTDHDRYIYNPKTLVLNFKKVNQVAMFLACENYSGSSTPLLLELCVKISEFVWIRPGKVDSLLSIRLEF